MRRATDVACGDWYKLRHFYPRSPCGERRQQAIKAEQTARISIHALLAESDRYHKVDRVTAYISIHALLAESDNFSAGGHIIGQNFYPRSPCGERPPSIFRHCTTYLFLSTLSLRRATLEQSASYNAYMISIHALLAESDVHYDNYNLHCVISIHALLAESDRPAFFDTAQHIYFYPRSPCGERQ